MKLTILYIVFFLFAMMITNRKKTQNFLISLYYRIKNKKNMEKCIVIIAISIILSFLLELFLNFYIYEIVKDTRYVLFFYSCNVFSIYRMYFFFIFLCLGNIILFFDKKKIHKYRYIISLGLLIMLILGEFTGSSLGFFDGMLTENTPEYHTTTLLGFNRGIRGDEWATEKPMYFAQMNSKEKMPYYNSNLSINEKYDMVVSAFSPVKDIIILARPELFGFFVLDKDKAFSFYWNYRILFLFMAMYELLYVLLRKNEVRSFLGAVIITFSYPVQWWLSQSSILIIANGSAFCSTLYYFLKKHSFWEKTLYSSLGILFTLGYIFTMYPALQVPFGYLFFLIAIYVIWLCREEIKDFPLQKRFLFGSFFLIGIGIICVRFIDQSRSALQVMTNTVYPGKVRDWEILPKDYLLYSFVSIFCISKGNSIYESIGD